MDGSAVLELHEIEKTYSGRRILNGVSLQVPAGECVALTGPNGCGKSTLLRVAAGLSLADKGRVVSYACGSTQYVPDHFPPIHLTGERFLQRMARMDCEADERLIRQFHMEDCLSESISSYSKGMRGKIGALQALLAKPKLLLMDEPVSGQDAEARETFIQAVRNLMKGGCAVLMAGHEAELVGALASRVYRIQDGELVREDGLPERKEAGCLCEKCPLRANGLCAGREKRHA